MPRMKKEKAAAGEDLKELARLYGIELSYEDVFKKHQEATPESLLRVLQVLGVPLAREADASDALRARRQDLWRRGMEPIALAWDGRADALTLRLPQRQTQKRASCRLRLENGEEQRWDADLEGHSNSGTSQLEGVAYTENLLSLPNSLPCGYHRLEVEVGKRRFATLLISAPVRAYAPEEEASRRTWGVFLPLYALHSKRSWGCGDFTDLRNLLRWVHSQGGGVTATLPLLASFLDEPFECSPYSPVSRLFWNELYLDVEALPELARCPAARALLRSAEFINERTALCELRQVDYRRQMALKRCVLAELARMFFRAPAGRADAFARFLADNPQAEDYARFRAAGERLRRPWPQWPAPLRDGTIGPNDYDDEARQYHLYVQWAAEEQLSALAAEARRAGPGLYLDLPLGVNGHGYDVWREREAFAVEASGGAAPDAVFTKGQDWGFPPLHPERIRSQGYRHVLSYLRRQLAHAGVLRIDHMPVFHRLFWIPHGMEARQGVYVRYPAEELYAVFSLESHRHRALLVGEDLGTVPPEVPQAMAQHNVQRMYVVQYALQDDPKEALPSVPSSSVASINTHDMPPFAAYCEGRDIDQRQQLDLLGDQVPEREREHRRAMVDALAQFLRAKGQPCDDDDPSSILRACLQYMAASGPRVVLVNLEDLWLETQTQNLPGTADEHPNWRNKARHGLEEFSHLPQVIHILRSIDATVRGETTG